MSDSKKGYWIMIPPYSLQQELEAARSAELRIIKSNSLKNIKKREQFILLYSSCFSTQNKFDLPELVVSC